MDTKVASDHVFNKLKHGGRMVPITPSHCDMHAGHCIIVTHMFEALHPGLSRHHWSKRMPPLTLSQQYKAFYPCVHLPIVRDLYIIPHMFVILLGYTGNRVYCKNTVFRLPVCPTRVCFHHNLLLV